MVPSCHCAHNYKNVQVWFCPGTYRELALLVLFVSVSTRLIQSSNFDGSKGRWSQRSDGSKGRYGFRRITTHSLQVANLILIVEVGDRFGCVAYWPRMSVDILGTSWDQCEAWFNIAWRPRKPEGSLGRTAQDVHLDSHTAPELWSGINRALVYKWTEICLASFECNTLCWQHSDHAYHGSLSCASFTPEIFFVVDWSCLLWHSILSKQAPVSVQTPRQVFRCQNNQPFDRGPSIWRRRMFQKRRYLTMLFQPDIPMWCKQQLIDLAGEALPREIFLSEISFLRVCMQ